MTNRDRSATSVPLNVFLCVMIALAVGGIVWWIHNSEPVAQRETATKRDPMLVETVAVTRGDYKPQISVLGRVVASKEVILRPRVEGEVVEIAENFEPGAMVKAGELLAKLDPADFENSLTTRLSELQQAEAEAKAADEEQELAELRRLAEAQAAAEAKDLAKAEAKAADAEAKDEVAEADEPAEAEELAEEPEIEETPAEEPEAAE